MNESYTIEERYLNLIMRAETYFHLLAEKPNGAPEGVKRWLEDLYKTRQLEDTEPWRGIGGKTIDVPFA